jgi:hypothetical protein
MRAAPLIALLLCACASDGASESPGDAGVPAMDARVLEPPEGDWFVCANEACDELQTTGLRLLAHEAFHLQAATYADGGLAHFGEGDPYCVSEPFGRYEYAGDILTLTFHDGGLTADTVLALDDSGLTTHGGDMRKVRQNATGRWHDTLCLLP